MPLTVYSYKRSMIDAMANIDHNALRISTFWEKKAFKCNSLRNHQCFRTQWGHK